MTVLSRVLVMPRSLRLRALIWGSVTLEKFADVASYLPIAYLLWFICFTVDPCIPQKIVYFPSPQTQNFCVFGGLTLFLFVSKAAYPGQAAGRLCSSLRKGTFLFVLKFSGLTFTYNNALLSMVSLGNHPNTETTGDKSHIRAFKKQFVRGWYPGWRVQSFHGYCKVRKRRVLSLHIITNATCWRKSLP